MPLFQDLLEACFFLAHPEAKDRPSEFDWQRASTKNLRELARKRKKKSGRASREKRAAAQERFRQRRKARLGEEAYNQRRAAELRAWRASESGQRHAARLAEIEYTAARKAKERSKRLGERLAALSVAQLEAPTYVVAIPGKKTIREKWPLQDAAALWIAAHGPDHRVDPELLLAAHGVHPPHK